MNYSNNTIQGTGSALMGAGIALVQQDPQLGLLLIGVGVILNILVAYLQKKGLEVQGDLG